ncbi:MAG TPA: phage tail sheath C-terminal domain-containing protein, partial [Chthoniobacterales bacterium]|nr:phage tail sheath C-terminal domain-containing protein [Chthoniobacterales bacterium]
MRSDPEWKYVNLRSYLAHLRRSIEKTTKWVVFELNDPFLWRKVRSETERLLLIEYRKGALVGRKPEQAFFVR